MGLIDDVKHKLNVTWSDTDTDAKINDLVASAQVVMRHKLGITNNQFDFSTAGLEKSLFLNYCFYEWNDSSDEFSMNYLNDILQCRAKWEVDTFVDD